jgi:predicted transcriptional regulator of viral defense system
MKFEELLTHFGNRPFFELREVIALSDDSPKSLKNQLSDWSKKGKIVRLRKGKYLLAEPYRAQMPSVYYVSNMLLQPSYVSLQTALQFHGLIPEAVGMIQAVTSRQGNEWETELGRFQYRSIKQERFWGYEQMHVEDSDSTQGRYLMARAEKALIDLFYLRTGEWTRPRIREMRFQNLERIDFEQLLDDALRFDSRKVKIACERLVESSEESNL